MITSELDATKPYIFEIPNVLSAAECRNWIARIQSLGTEAATINSARGAEVDSQIRNNRRLIIDDDEWAGILFERVRESVPPEIHEMSLAGVNERLRCYEYEVGHRFAPHSDGVFVRTEKERSCYTYMIYLNEEFEGGETRFFVEPEVVIKPKTGSSLFFQHPIIHEGSQVLAGVKYVLRTDLIYRLL